MKSLLAVFSLASLSTPVALGQAPGSWEASSGRLPTEVVPAWGELNMGACSGATASLSQAVLTIDDATPCPDDVLVYSVMTSPELGTTLIDHWAEARLRVLQSTGADPDRGIALLGIAPWSDCPWYVFVDTDEVKLFWGTEELGRFPLDATVMRTYRIEASASTRLSSLYVDGQLRISGGVPAPTCFTASTPRSVVFGNASALDGGVTQWEFVRHNTGTGEVAFCVETQSVNSTGSLAHSSSSGSRSVVANDFVLETDGLPVGSFGYYLCSRAFSAPLPLVSGEGSLCLGGAIGRFNRAGEILMANSSGRLHLAVDLADLPQPSGAVAALPGDTWHFQLWYRDANPAPTSNTSTALQLVFE